MARKKAKESQRQLDPESEELLHELRDKLYSDNTSTRRRAAYSLSWMQEDGLEILKQVLFGSCPKKARNAAAYGLRSMRGRMRQMAFDLLNSGLKSDDAQIVGVCEHAMAIIRQKWPEKFSGKVAKHLPKVAIKEIADGKKMVGRSPRRAGSKRAL